MENGLPWPGSSAAEAALREHFSGEEGDKAVEQQVGLQRPSQALRGRRGCTCVLQRP